MDINLLSTIIAIIAGLLTIIQILKEFINPISNAKVQQDNKGGNNYYTDNSTYINKTSKTTIITSPTNTSSSNEIEYFVIIVGITLVLTTITLAFYSLTYKLIPALCFLFLAISVYKDVKVPFENMKAKIQWVVQKLLIFILILILFFPPNSVLNLIEQIQPVSIKSFPLIIGWLVQIGKIIIDLFQESILVLYILLGRIIFTFGTLMILIQSVFNKVRIHRVQSKSSLVGFVAVFVILTCVSNVEYIWILSEPYRYNIDNWFNPTP